jgi:uncharacterized protein YcbK (DUF882 family)
MVLDFRISMSVRTLEKWYNFQHLHGRGVDIRLVNPASWARFQAWLDQHWYGALGYGVRRGFVHLDTRNGKGWRTGGEKGPRWNY